jgi:demethylmenaquinone methyltransferase/2-methoxy-6-polyprenyl-1,4-benzoquinol methylase
MTNTTHFGYKTVAEDEKVREVAKVFHSVAAKYDIMNDVMSAGLHRLEDVHHRPRRRASRLQMPRYRWRHGRSGQGVRQAGGPSGEVWLTDINESMLRVGVTAS